MLWLHSPNRSALSAISTRRRCRFTGNFAAGSHLLESCSDSSEVERVENDTIEHKGEEPIREVYAPDPPTAAMSAPSEITPIGKKIV
jgi:hypothetical protein